MTLNWKTTTDGVWSAVAGENGFVPLVKTDAAGDCGGVAGSPASALQSSIVHRPSTIPPEFPLQTGEITCRRVGGNLVLSLPLDETEKLYGVGLNFDSLNQRETVRELKVDHYGMYDNGHSHAPVPFYVSDRGYGVFVNVSERVKVYAGTTHPTSLPHPPMYDRGSDPRWRGVSISRRVEVLIPGPGAEVVIFAGPTMLQAVQRFNMFCGGGCLPPRWGLGFWHRVPIDYTAEQVVAETLRHLGRGLSSQDLGRALGISPETVKSHIKAIFHKLAVVDRAEAVARAYELGLLSVDR